MIFCERKKVSPLNMFNHIISQRDWMYLEMIWKVVDLT